jgi:hypothetical protein
MRQSRSSGSAEGVMGNHDSYSDARLKLFARYRLNGSIQELTALYRRKPLYLS